MYRTVARNMVQYFGYGNSVLVRQPKIMEIS